MSNDHKNDPKDPATPPENVTALPTRKIQLLGVPPNLISDIRDQLRTTGTHKEVDGLLNQLAQCQVIDVTVQDAPRG